MTKLSSLRNLNIFIISNVSKAFRKELVLASNSDFLIPLSLKPNVGDFKHFKLWILLYPIIKVWNIKGWHHQVAKIKGFENLSLWQRLNSFVRYHYHSTHNLSKVRDFIEQLRMEILPWTGDLGEFSWSSSGSVRSDP